jgi:hypothetical protein
VSSIPDQGTHWAPGNPLKAAQVALGKAAGYVRAWHARQTTPERTYVAAGHDAIAAIDQAIRALHEVREVLVGEIRRDEDEREQQQHGNSGPGGDLR